MTVHERYATLPDRRFSLAPYQHAVAKALFEFVAAADGLGGTYEDQAPEMRQKLLGAAVAAAAGLVGVIDRDALRRAMELAMCDARFDGLDPTVADTARDIARETLDIYPHSLSVYWRKWLHEKGLC